MKFQYASDLHQEFPENRAYLQQKPIVPSAPYLLLAGDIHVFNQQEKEVDTFFDYLSENWIQVFIVPGNHENYLSGNMAELFHVDLDIRPNVKYVNHQKIELEGVDLFFSTLWSQCNSDSIQGIVRDFYNCTYNDDDYTYNHHNELHDRAVAWLNSELSSKSTKPRIVVSHFVPTLKVDGSFKAYNAHTRMLKDYYVANLDGFLPKWYVDYWIYGHNHSNRDCFEYDIQFLSNMLGYVKHGEHEKFVNDKILKI